MFHQPFRQFTGLLAAFGLFGVTLLPPEHVHLEWTTDGHHSDLAHRHYASHEPVRSQATFDHADDHIEWLPTSFTKPYTTRLTLPALQPLGVVSVQTPDVARKAVFRVVRVSSHDPPWIPPSGLRAPPAFL